MALGDVIARLSVHLGLETAAFEKGSRKAVAETQSLGKKMGRIAGAIGTAFVASIGVDTVRAWKDATRGALEFAGSLGETAQQLGVTTNELQEYRYVASQTGIEQAAMDKALQKTTRTLGELATPTKAQTAALKELGLSAKDLEGLGTGDFIALLADKFKGLTAAQQAALGAQLGLGRSFQTMIPLLNEGSAGIERMRKAAHDLGIVISESAIRNADANVDLLSTYEQINEAQKNATLALPENVKAYMAYEKAVLDTQLALYKAVGATSEFISANGQLDTALRDFGKNTGVQDFFASFNASVSAWAKTTHDAIVAIPQWIGTMVSRIGTLITGALGAMWDSAIAKINTVKRAFFNLYDAVVGHSYVPDMVDGIGAEMARLDALMVKPAQSAASKTADTFRQLRDDLAEYFPEIGKADDFNARLARIDTSKLSDDAKTEATMRAWRIFTSGSPFGGGGMGGPDFGDSGPLVEGFKGVGDAIEKLTEKSKIASVRIAKSFADMATSTLQSLSRLASAIKGGGFFDILEAALGVGIQLGQAGLFGKGFATQLNAAPGFANGTNFAPGGMAMVGERGPELVHLPRGSRVTPNHKLAPTVVQLVVGPGQMFVPTVEAISGSVSIQQVSQLTKGAHRMQRQAL